MFVIRAYPVQKSYPDSLQNAFVARFNRSHGVIKAFALDGAKRFKTAAAAQKFIETYANCGYGLESSLATIEAVQ